MIGYYKGYPGQYLFEFRNDKPSGLYTEVLQDLQTKGKPSFSYLGRVDPPGHFSKEKRPEPPLVNKFVLPYLLDNHPELVDPNFCLNTKYMLTAKYAKAEYVSMSRYSNDYELPESGPWKAASLMLSEAFVVMDRSPVLSVDSSIAWLDRQTSPGWPWSKIDKVKATVLDTPWFKPWYVGFEHSISLDRANPWFWRSFIKDEVKKKTDVMADNPRSILASPIHASVLGNRLFGPMNERVNTAGETFKVPCWIGISKFRRSWHSLALRILALPNRAHGDCTRFDGTVSSAPFDVIKALRKSFLIDKNFEKHIDFFYKNVIDSQIVGWYGDVYQKHMGQPSGQTNTLHDNTLIHTLYFFYHWCKHVCADSRFEATWLSFSTHVNLVIMGDDVIYSYSDEVKTLMAPSAVAATFAEMRVTLKFNEGKDDSPPMEEMEFCSMHFKLHGDVYVPIMKAEKMLASAFIKNSPSPRILLRRLLGIRVEVWWDKKVLSIIEGAIDYLLSEYSQAMSGPPTFQGGDDAPLELIMTLRWPAYVIEDHYLSAPQ